MGAKIQSYFVVEDVAHIGLTGAQTAAALEEASEMPLLGQEVLG